MNASCQNCKHFDHLRRTVCAAFPGGIPLPITWGEIIHTEPFPGDNGIRFEPMTAADQDALRERVVQAQASTGGVTGMGANLIIVDDPP